MANVTLEDHGKVALVRMTGGATNALSPAMVDELFSALTDAGRRFRGVVLAGGTKFFSIGLNLPELIELDARAMEAFWTRFEDTVISLYSLPVPTAAAIAGHATAGGAILALACDFRFVAAGRKLIGLNEVKIGLAVPYLPDRILRQIVGDRAATRMTYRGEFIEPQEALSLGLVDGVAAEAQVEAQALSAVAELAALPPLGLALIKHNRVRDLKADFEARRQTLMEEFLKCWFSPPARAALVEASKKF
jgi:enoyl-CoA hydratase/carnithine racemase